MTVHSVPRAVVAGTGVPPWLAARVYRQFCNENTNILALSALGIGRRWDQSYRALQPKLYNRPQKLGHSQGALAVLEDVLTYPQRHATVILMSGAFRGSWAAPLFDLPGVRCMRPDSPQLIDLAGRMATRLEELEGDWPVGLRIIALGSAHDGLLTSEGIYPLHPRIECYCIAAARPERLPRHVQWIKVDELALLAHLPSPLSEVVARFSDVARFHLTEGLLPATKQVVEALWGGWRPKAEVDGIIRVPRAWSSGLHVLPPPDPELEAA